MRIGVLDSGLRRVAAVRQRFAPGHAGVRADPETQPILDHGTLVADLVGEMAPAGVELLDAQIFLKQLH